MEEENFERWYLRNKQALAKAGIDTKKSAKIIYEDYGLARRNVAGWRRTRRKVL